VGVGYFTYDSATLAAGAQCKLADMCD